jgi:hypothetical protein
MAITGRSNYACVHCAWEVLVMAEPGDDRAGRHAGRGRMRASHADRDQVIDTLKDAYVQGRLTKDEFDSRVGHALASRTHADLAALTSDLPAGPPAGPPAARPPRRPVQARRPPRPENATVKNGARVIAVTTVLTASVWAGALFSNADNQVVGTLVSAFTFLWFGIVFLVGSVMLESRLKQRSSRQLPPASGPGGQASERAVPADPASELRPGDHGRPQAAEASRSPVARPSLLREPRLSPS